MTDENQSTQPNEHKPAALGARLKSARESLGLERKDAAAQLRLTEKVIMMMEKDLYPADLPTTFIRGYLRAYGKLLQIPEHELKKAIDPIKPRQSEIDSLPTPIKPLEPVTSSNYFMQIFTYLIIFTVVGLSGIWWYTRTPAQTVENQGSAQAEPVTPAISPANIEPSAPPANSLATPPVPAKPAIIPAVNAKQQVRPEIIRPGSNAKPNTAANAKPNTAANANPNTGNKIIPNQTTEPPITPRAPIRNADASVKAGASSSGQAADNQQQLADQQEADSSDVDSDNADTNDNAD